MGWAAGDEARGWVGRSTQDVYERGRWGELLNRPGEGELGHGWCASREPNGWFETKWGGGGSAAPVTVGLYTTGDDGAVRYRARGAYLYTRNTHNTCIPTTKLAYESTLRLPTERGY